jgi:hypothetical protein
MKLYDFAIVSDPLLVTGKVFAKGEATGWIF